MTGFAGFKNYGTQKREKKRLAGLIENREFSVEERR
jgi:hypothetical protein